MGPAQPEVDGLACLVQSAEDVIEPVAPLLVAPLLVAPLLVSPLPVATTTVRWALRLGSRAMSGHGRPVVSGLLGVAWRIRTAMRRPATAVAHIPSKGVVETCHPFVQLPVDY